MTAPLIRGWDRILLDAYGPDPAVRFSIRGPHRIRTDPLGCNAALGSPIRGWDRILPEAYGPDPAVRFGIRVPHRIRTDPLGSNAALGSQVQCLGSDPPTASLGCKKCVDRESNPGHLLGRQVF